VSGDVRDFADGDSVLPGVNDIPRTTDKGNTGGRRLAGPSADVGAPTGNSNLTPSIRPVHKR
jgi:hypothetical protein